MNYLFNAAIIFGTGVVVFGLGYSGWWFLLAIFLLVS